MDQKQFTPADRMSAEVIWMDKQKVVCNVSIDSKNYNKDATISVRTGAYGNAVVALKVNNDILWSWHIWITPELNTVSFNGQIWMDRNLGAVSNEANNPLSKGNHYQWGRKDPFPNSADLSNSEPTLYALNAGSPTIAKASPTIQAKENLKTSILNPLTFIKGATAKQSNDWYSAEISSWNTRWNNNEKTPSDPCPEGWKVGDSGVFAGSPWSTLTNVAAGCRLDSDGEITAVGSSTYIWESTINQNFPHALFHTSTSNIVKGKSYRASGFSVRCIKE